MEFRKADIHDLDAIIETRKKQLIDEGYEPNTDIDQSLRDFFGGKFRENSIVEWLGEEDGKIVATAAVIFMTYPPSFRYPTGVRGYITNVYTAPEYRGRGIATSMLKRVKDEARSRGIRKLILMASDHGKPVYLRFGFVESEVWMDMDLPEES